MNPAEQFPPPLHNVLPLRFHTWVACYDSISEDQRQEACFHFYQGLTKKQFARVYGHPQPSQMIGRAEHHIEREWLLARVAEELLPARWTVSEWREVQTVLTSEGALSVSERLRLANGVFPRMLKTLVRDE